MAARSFYGTNCTYMRMYGCDEHPLELPRFVFSEYSNKECHPVWESPAELSIRGWGSQLMKWEAGEGISLPLVVLGPRTVEARDYDPKGDFVACIARHSKTFEGHNKDPEDHLANSPQDSPGMRKENDKRMQTLAQRLGKRKKSAQACIKEIMRKRRLNTLINYQAAT